MEGGAQCIASAAVECLHVQSLGGGLLWGHIHPRDYLSAAQYVCTALRSHPHPPAVARNLELSEVI